MAVISPDYSNKHNKPSLHDYAVSLDEILAFLILACNRITNLKYCKYFEVQNLKT